MKNLLTKQKYDHKTSRNDEILSDEELKLIRERDEFLKKTKVGDYLRLSNLPSTYIWGLSLDQYQEHLRLSDARKHKRKR